ncbi:DUF4429 domain-containing protein [Streptomyces afghaniensis]|uniref:DUF4429 domain-containing protein n=1 Tax=Streptomyces afghaniensis TaxID=66865 RepID=UPI002782F615|nr:DUF4429 domain-containing protein [Streptomyces afghaniensis]MDQ1016921.1 hypothetical protein [Streptomyces afghaniensis]
MAEIIQRAGTWAFEGGTVRITPGLHRSVPLFRQTYGEIAVPLEAVSGVLWRSVHRDLLTALVATAVTARLPHPSTRTAADHHDVLLRRLRELGELYREGVLTDEDFARTKAVVLRGF